MHIRTFLKPLSFIPALLLMYMIYSFSAQEGELSSSVSYKASCVIVEAADQVFDMGLDNYQVSYYATKINGVTRKLAHMTEYFLLAIAVSFPLYVYGLHGFLLMLLAGGLCIAFACGDEYHQSFVSGRSPSMKDVGIDSFGVFLGIIIVRIIGWTGRMTIFRPIKKEGKLSRKEKKRLKQQNLKNDTPYNGDPNMSGGYYNEYQNGSYSNAPGNGYRGPYTGPAYQNNPGDGYHGPYPGDPGYQNNGSYPNDPGFQGNGSYPNDPGFQSNSSYPNGPGFQNNGPYPSDPGFLSNGSYPNDPGFQNNGPYPSDPGFQNNGPYPSDPGFLSNGSYPNDPGFQGNGPYPSDPGNGYYGPAGQPYPYQPQTPQYMGMSRNPDESSDELSDDMPLAHLLKRKK